MKIHPRLRPGFNKAPRSKSWDMSRLPVLVLLALACLIPGSILEAHIGSQNVIFETEAGPYPTRVTIKAPEVVPGLAEIFVRIHAGKVEQVTALPVRYDSGRQGAPPPDIAVPVPGSENLYRAELWFMKSGAHSVIISITGEEGQGEVMVPFDALATRTLPMSRPLTVILVIMGTLLIALAASIAGAAVRHAAIPPGTEPSTRRLWGARFVTAIQLFLVIGLAYYGKTWWDEEERDYQNNRLYEPMASTATLDAQLTNELTLEITDERFRRGSPLLGATPEPQRYRSVDGERDAGGGRASARR